MKINSDIQRALAQRHYLCESAGKVDSTKAAYYSAFLFVNFGISVNKPQLVTKEMVECIKKLYRLQVPASFFANPQDMKYYTKAELFIEQVVSYFLAYGEDDCRVEIFKKDLPEYVEGDEMKLRSFEIISEEKAEEVCREVLTNYFSYKRPWSIDEVTEVYHFLSEVDCDADVLCGDNALTLVSLGFDPSFARFAYKKDLVKLSINHCGEYKTLSMPDKTCELIKKCLPYVKDCPMSKKQAKFYNKLLSVTGTKGEKASNDASPYKIATAALKAGSVLGAAKVYAASGSLLERNLNMLLSRANLQETTEILNMLGAKNPAVLFQMMTAVERGEQEPRTFTFFRNNLVKKHVETPYEVEWRKSVLKGPTYQLIRELCQSKIIETYKSMPPLGKVYIADNFYKIGLPLNTSATGKGIDVLPTGSRVPIKGDAIRSFVHWEHAMDIDASLIVTHEDGTFKTMSFQNYCAKPFDNSVLFSGDVTSRSGTEYYDIKIEELANKGYNFVFFNFRGFNSDLNAGEIYCGYQDKEDLETKAWDPKNIAFKFHVKGDTRSCYGFAIDLKTREMIILNLMVSSDCRVVQSSDVLALKKYVSENYLKINMGTVIAARGTVVDDPGKADIVFSDEYVSADNGGQKVVRSYDLEKLVAVTNGK